MNTPPRKILGLALIIASLALFGWLAYEPAEIVTALRLGAVASEAVAVVATLAVIVAGLAVGGIFAIRASPRR